jgi:hypothetical protein
MRKPKEMDVVRRAYELWQQAGEPADRDEEFYHQAKAELQARLSGEDGSGNSEDSPTNSEDSPT